MGAWRALSAKLKALLLIGVGSQAVHAQSDPAGQDWEAARSANTVEAYEQFLEAHPDFAGRRCGVRRAGRSGAVGRWSRAGPRHRRRHVLTRGRPRWGSI